MASASPAADGGGGVVSGPPAADDGASVGDGEGVASGQPAADGGASVGDGGGVVSGLPVADGGPAVTDGGDVVGGGGDAVPGSPALDDESRTGGAGGDGGAEAVRGARLRAALRWAAAVTVFALVGASTAYGITRLDRTDVPGLETRSDGRWAYPTLTKPPLPSGSPAPFTRSNPSGAHYADLRALVLPAPEGATQDKALAGSDGWSATKDFLKEFEETRRDDIQDKLTDAGLRHIAARGWTTPDGVTTRVYLLRFGSVAVTEQVLGDDLTSYDAPVYPVRGADAFERDEDFPLAPQSKNVALTPYAETKPYGSEQVRLAFLSAGDVLAMIVQAGKGGMPVIPFQQTVVLQSELLE
ncbi:hypothetical protein ABZ490_38210 [Streptomyces sp. NPDC005811]|uniref:hypothetical protein n=1 Tax=Streptomyces sp. NPDC005811 TaxID=3154565 RepID=UPI003408FC9E